MIEDWSLVDPEAPREDAWVSAPAVFLDPTAKTGVKVDGVSTWVEGWSYVNSGLAISTQEIRTIHGVVCRRIKFRNRSTAEDEGDAWISEDLKILMCDNEIKGDWKKTWEITAVEFRDPPNDAFEIPLDFHYTEESP
jgi:hypothetical protein